MIKAITGKANWRTAPATTLEAAKGHMDATAPHSGHALTSHGHANDATIGGPFKLASVFNWSGQAGQPSGLWGSNDGASYYVWNPSNFNVNYANSAGNSDTLDGNHATYFQPASTAITTSTIASQYVAGFANAVGSAPQFACRAWVHFNGTNGSIYASGNVASVSMPSGGKFVITFATAMPDTNYACIGIATNAGSWGTLVFENLDSLSPRTANTVTVLTCANNGTVLVSDTRVSVVIFR